MAIFRNWFHNSNLCLYSHLEKHYIPSSKPCVTQWIYEPCPAGPPERDRSWWRILTKCGPLEKGKPLQHSCLENPTNSVKRQKDTTLEDEPTKSGVQYAPGEGRRNSSRKKEKAGPQQKEHSAVYVSSGESKFWSCKVQYCIRTWNIRSINQGKLDMVGQDTERMNIDILGISELKLRGMGELNSDGHHIYHCGQESLRRNGAALIVNKRVWNAVFGCKLKNDRMLFVHFEANHSISE